MKRSLKYYTLRYFALAILGIIAVWAASFYFFIIEEVYDNIDDGLKDSEIRIKKEIDRNPDVLLVDKYDLAQFKITQLPEGNYNYQTHIYNSKMYMPYDQDDEPVRILQNIFLQNGKPYQLEVYTSTVEEDELLEDLLIALLVLYAALVISLILMNHFILKKAWNPFYQILRNLKAYKIGSKNSFELRSSNIKEFDELKKELREMLRRNEFIYEQQKQFIGNASHELQTPIAIASGKLELLIQESELNENQIVKINEIHKILNRLKRLNKSLLMLSRIENQQFQPIEKKNFNELIRQSILDMDGIAELKNIQLILNESDPFEMEINPDLATVLIENLMKNAILHSPNEVEIKIEVSENLIQIINPGEKSLEASQIFNRFYKDSDNENSTGLGLAIVKSIVGIYPEMRIQYRFENEHIFEIRKSN